MKRVLLSILVPLVIFLLFILWISLTFSGGWTGFFSGNLQCDAGIAIENPNQHECGYMEFFSETLYFAYGFFISGWWVIVVGAMILIYGGAKFMKNFGRLQ